VTLERVWKTPSNIPSIPSGKCRFLGWIQGRKTGAPGRLMFGRKKWRIRFIVSILPLLIIFRKYGNDRDLENKTKNFLSPVGERIYPVRLKN
jgi:hypothetical protein